MQRCKHAKVQVNADAQKWRVKVEPARCACGWKGRTKVEVKVVNGMEGVG